MSNANHWKSPQESTRSLQGFVKLQKHSFGWNRPVPCSNSSWSQFKNFPSNQRWSSKAQGFQQIKQQLQKIKEREKFYYDKHCSKELLPLDEGDKVTMKHDKKWIRAIVVDKHHTPRSYIVQTPRGQRYRRNNKHLNKSWASEVLSKETVVTKTSKLGQAISCTCAGTSKLSETEAPTGHTQKPEIRTRSSRLVKQFTYLKDYEQ